MQTVYVISTGGTIEKVYSEQTGSVANLDTKIDRYFRLLRLPDLRVEITHLMNKDSLEMTDADREVVLATVRSKLRSPASVAITHGTDTLVETGMLLKKALPDLSVPIVLTGAMTPLGFEGSDGLQNLTESLLAARLLPPGVYLVIHNQVFPIDRVRKDRERARFVWSDTPQPDAAEAPWPAMTRTLRPETTDEKD
jgi:L-asparaginase